MCKQPLFIVHDQLNSFDDGKLTPVDHVTYFRRGLFDSSPISWLVDVITEKGIDMYLERVESCLAKLRAYCTENRAIVQAARRNPATCVLSTMLPR